MTDLQARIAIEDLLTRYATAIDGHQWDLLDGIFVPETHFDYRASCGIAGAFPEVKAWLAEVLPAMFEATQHLVLNREIHIDADWAVSRAAFLNPNRMRIDGQLRLFTCGGYYHDRLERRPEGWRIVRRIEDCLWWQDPIPGLPEVPPGLPAGVDPDPVAPPPTRRPW